MRAWAIRNAHWLRRLGLLVGVVLLVGALAVIFTQRDVLSNALAAIASPSPLYVTLLIAAIAMNVVLSGVMFSLLISRYGKVGILEMQALLASTTLINYLPLRPGLFGRLAYHKSVNRIALIESTSTVVQGVVLSFAATAYAVGVVALAMYQPATMWFGTIAPAPLLIALSFTRTLRIWSLALLIRYCELLVWAVRYFAAFALLGLDVAWSSSLAFACVSMVATLVPFVSNGLGLREWAVGLLAPVITAHQMSLGITAELVNRAAELLVVSLLGVAGMLYLARLQRTSASKA